MAIKMLSSLAAIGIRAPGGGRGSVANSSLSSHEKMMRTLEHEVRWLPVIPLCSLEVILACSAQTALSAGRCAAGASGARSPTLGVPSRTVSSGLVAQLLFSQR